MHDAGKLEAFAPAHQLGGGAHVPNYRRGLRQLPWVDRVTPPDPATVQESYEGADASILGAGYHEGATYFELQGFAEAVLAVGETVTLLTSPLSVHIGTPTKGEGGAAE